MYVSRVLNKIRCFLSIVFTNVIRVNVKAGVHFTVNEVKIQRFDIYLKVTYTIVLLLFEKVFVQIDCE